MTDPPESNNNPSFLGGIASIVGLLGISLYFTGWIYRLAYYGFFQLEVTTLDFPVESFLLVPIQVLFGNFMAIVKTAIALVLLPFLIQASLWLLEILGNSIKKKLQQPSTTPKNGDVELFKKLQQEDTNDVKRGRVWRLPIERRDWIYLFATLPVDAEPDEKPAVIAIEKGDPGDRLMILSPINPETN